MGSMQRSTIREILKLTSHKDVISFAGGLPAPELFPLEQFQKAMLQAFEEDGASALQYDVTEGFFPLKEFMCHWLGKQGIACRPENMLFTNGSQQALDLIGKILLDPEDTVLVENPTYLGAIQAFNAYQARYAVSPIDDEGLIPAPLENILASRKVRFSYVVPTFSNPSGATMSLARRKAFLKILREKKLWVIEDDPYGLLRFKKSPVPSLYRLNEGRGVFYLTTFSKILSPGIRLGVVVAEADAIAALVMAKQAADLQPNSLIQRAVYHYARNGDLDRHIPLIIEAYKQRAGAMEAAMKKYFPKNVHWVSPDGGMFIYCRLPEGVSATKLFTEAIRNKVAYVAGEVFHAAGGGENTMRLNFTNSTFEQIEEGIKRLGMVLQQSAGSV